MSPTADPASDPEGPESPDEESSAPAEDALTRLRHAFLRPSRAQTVVAVLLFVLAFAAITQVKSNGRDDPYDGLRQSELIQTLNGLSAASRRADSDIAELERTRDALRSSSVKRSAALERARQEANTLGILAGTTPAVGPGIKVTVKDPDDKLSVSHLLDGIQELRDAGAEAMQINGEVRVIASTSLEKTEDGLIIDGKEVVSPYVLIAIGDADTLAEGLEFQGGFVDDVKLDGASVTIEKLDRVRVDVVRSLSTPEYADVGP